MPLSHDARKVRVRRDDALAEREHVEAVVAGAERVHVGDAVHDAVARADLVAACGISGELARQDLVVLARPGWLRRVWRGPGTRCLLQRSRTLS